MALTWAQRRDELLSDCIVSPDVFNPMVDRLAEFVVPYQQVRETEAGQRNLHLYLQGPSFLTHLTIHGITCWLPLVCAARTAYRK